MKIKKTEIDYLRDLAKKQLEYANLPIMKRRKQNWYKHNGLSGDKPMVVMEMDTFWPDMKPEPKCETEMGRYLEDKIQRHLINHEMIDDDKVVPDAIQIPLFFGIDLLGVEIVKHNAIDDSGNDLGYSWEHPIKDLSQDYHKIKNATCQYNEEKTLAMKAAAEDVLSDILTVELVNTGLDWFAMLTMQAVELMGMQNMFIAMMVEPDRFKALMQKLLDNVVYVLGWMEREGHLTLNNENHYVGSGSYGFSHELPQGDFDGHVRLKDRWLNINSQEAVGISPELFHELVYPYYETLAKKAGFVYYGCCEPVSEFWEKSLHALPNLRKLSISKWCNEEYMGEVLRERNVIYSRKPDPNFVGVGTNLDEAGFAEHIKKTLLAARGTSAEIIFRDIYVLDGNRKKPGRAVEITRECIQKHWK